MAFHGDIDEACGIHIINAFEYVDAAARASATLTAADIGKVAHQLDDNTFWVLIDDSPLTWRELTNVSAVNGPSSSTDNAIARFDGITGKLIQNSAVIIDDSANVSGINTLQIGAIRFYSSSAVDPVSPVPANGDQYFNTALNLQMQYDAVRSKWLSIESAIFHFGRNGSVQAGQYYRGPDGKIFSDTLGFEAILAGTVISIGYNRADPTATTFSITADGTPIESLASAAAAGSSNSLNGDFSSGNSLAVKNTGALTTTDVIGWFRIKWRV